MKRDNQRQSNGRPRGAHERADVLDLVDAAFRYAFSLTHHRHDAEDLVQQACMRVMRTKGNVIEKGYLFVTIRNLFRDSCRRKSTVSFISLDEEQSRGDLALHRIDSQLDLESMLSTLSSDDRELLYLNCIEGFTAQEISDLTGHPRGTILSQLARTKRKLSDRFRTPSHETKGTDE